MIRSRPARTPGRSGSQGTFIEQVNVIADAILVEELVELLVIDAV